MRSNSFKFAFLTLATLSIAGIMASPNYSFPTDVIYSQEDAHLVPLAEDTVPGGVNESDRRVTMVLESMEEALKVLNTAYTKNNENVAGVRYKSMAIALQNARIVTPNPGTDLSSCKEKVLAYVNMADRKKVHICALTFQWYSALQMAQVLIHESAHLIGQANECTATGFEINAWRSQYENLSFVNGYMAGCKLH